MNERTKFMIINGIEPETYPDDFYLQVMCRLTENSFSYFFKSFITDQMVNNHPDAYFGGNNNTFVYPIQRNHSVNFIEKWYKHLAFSEILKRQRDIQPEFFRTICIFNYHERFMVKALLQLN